MLIAPALIVMSGSASTSRRSTFTPRSRSSQASIRPHGPAPEMITSWVMTETLLVSKFCRVYFLDDILAGPEEGGDPAAHRRRGHGHVRRARLRQRLHRRDRRSRGRVQGHGLQLLPAQGGHLLRPRPTGPG